MDDLKQPHDKHDETPKCCYGWLMKPACLDDCPHATEAAKKLLMHRLSYPATASATLPKDTLTQYKAFAQKLRDGDIFNEPLDFPEMSSQIHMAADTIDALVDSQLYVHDEVKK